MITAVATSKALFTLPCALEQEFSDCGTVRYPVICASARALFLFTCCSSVLWHAARNAVLFTGLISASEGVGAIIFTVITIHALTPALRSPLRRLSAPLATFSTDFFICLSLLFNSGVAVLIHSPAHSLCASVFHKSFLGKSGLPRAGPAPRPARLNSHRPT